MDLQSASIRPSLFIQNRQAMSTPLRIPWVLTPLMAKLITAEAGMGGEVLGGKEPW